MMIQGIARQFTGRGHQLGLVNKAETQLDSPLPNFLARQNNIVRVLQRHQLTLQYAHHPIQISLQ
jgi:hypothetical protein